MSNTDYCCVICNYHGKTKQNLKKHLASNKHFMKSVEHQRNIDKESASRCAQVINNNNGNDIYDKIAQIKTEMNSFKTELKLKDEKIARQDEIIKDLLARICYLEITPAHQVIVNGNGNVNLGGITQNINIKLQKYGHENLPNDMKALISAIKGVNTVIPNLIEFLHFHPKYPENNNIKIPNKKENKIKVYDGTRWITQNKKQTLESKIQSTIDLLDTDQGKNAYNNCSDFIKSRLDETIATILQLGNEKLKKAQISDLKRIREDVENIILDNQIK